MGEISDRIADACQYHLEVTAQGMEGLGLTPRGDDQAPAAGPSYPVDPERVRLYAELALYRGLDYPPQDEDAVASVVVGDADLFGWLSADPWDAVPPSIHFVDAMRELIAAEHRRVQDNHYMDAHRDDALASGLPAAQKSTATGTLPANYGYGEVLPRLPHASDVDDSI